MYTYDFLGLGFGYDSGLGYGIGSLTQRGWVMTEAYLSSKVVGKAKPMPVVRTRRRDVLPVLPDDVCLPSKVVGRAETMPMARERRRDVLLLLPVEVTVACATSLPLLPRLQTP